MGVLSAFVQTGPLAPIGERIGRCLLTIAVLLATGVVCPASAAAAPIDTTSDQIALVAYDRYVTALVAGVGSGARADLQYIASVRVDCGRVLAPLASRPPGQVSQGALLDLGEEIGGDLAIELHTEAIAPFARLKSAIGKLRWSTRRTNQAVTAFLSAAQASLLVPLSDLCADARSLASQPTQEPAGTRLFLANYLPAAKLARQRLGPFLAVLARYATPTEASVIATIRRLVAEFNATAKADETADGATALTALGLE
jgi:hypothetical protein